jgi:hypothetical protein
VLLARVDERVNAEIAHEGDKLRTFASSATDQQGRPYTEVDALLERYLRETLPEAEDEAFFSVVAGQPTHRSLGTAPARLDTDPAFVARVAGAREPAYGWAESPAGAVRSAVLPVQVTDDARPAALVVLEFRDLQRREVTDAVRVLTLVGFGALAVAGLVSWLLAGRVLAPIRLVRQTAERVGESDLTRRIARRGPDRDGAWRGLPAARRLSRPPIRVLSPGTDRSLIAGRHVGVNEPDRAVQPNHT